jgi:hypothetical protein
MTYRNWNIDADLASLDLLGEFRGSRARASEYSSAIAVLVGIDELDSIIQSLDIQANENRTKDFLLIAFHVCLDVGDDCWTNLNSC